VFRRVVKREEAESVAKEHSVLYSEVSCKSNSGIDEMFELLTSMIVNKIKANIIKVDAVLK